MTPTTMRAWRTHEYGEPGTALQLDEVEVPEPGEGEVRVRALGIPLNLNDLERITGGNMMVRPDLPYAPGMEVMGIVDACGPGTEARAGQRVVGITRGAHGAFAEYSICPAVSLFDMPDDIPLPDAAALFFPFHLAWLGLFDRAELQAGETVLIHAAAGGSGSAAIQLAVDAGAHVIATVGSEEKVQLCRDLGAETVVNYTDRRVRPGRDGADRRQGGRRRLRQRGRGGDGRLAELHRLQRPLPHDGVRLGQDGRRREVDRPSQHRLGQRQALRRAPVVRRRRLRRRHQAGDGVELPEQRARGRDHAEQSSTSSGRSGCGPWSGRVVDFDDVPAAFEAMANRETVGRTIVRLWPD